MPLSLKVDVSSKDLGYKKLKDTVFRAEKSGAVRVGLVGEKANAPAGEGSTVVEVGAAHEFGAGKIPKRSFIRGWFDANQQDLAERLLSILKKTMKGANPNIELERLGAHSVGQIQEFITDRIPPPLKEETIERKGSSVPLIDTGQLRSSITYKVEGKK